MLMKKKSPNVKQVIICLLCFSLLLIMAQCEKPVIENPTPPNSETPSTPDSTNNPTNKFPIDCQTLGVWWWWHSDINNPQYLDFLVANDVDEIYLCDDRFGTETADFINTCAQKNLRVYWLAGEYEWIENPEWLYEQMERFVAYQNAHPNSAFAGIHFDIEPGQHEEFAARRTELITGLCDLAYHIKTNYNQLNISYDIPFWLDDIINYHGEQKEAYKFMIDYASRIFIMSYRDSATKIYDVAKDEYNYAKLVGKPLFFGVETVYSDEANQVSFYEEGKNYMYEQLNQLQNYTHEKCHIAIHQLRGWYNLHD